MSSTLDPRVNAYRPDIADARLMGQVESELFVEGKILRVAAPDEPLRRVPETDAPYETELLHGEFFRVFAEWTEDWVWGQCETDGYVGYLRTGALRPAQNEATHRVSALRTVVLSGPDVRLPPSGFLSFGSRIVASGEVDIRGTRLVVIGGGERAVPAVHVVPVDAPPEPDFVAVAERFMNVPYVWGGRTALGVDCSALLQLALMAAGVAAPRDSDMQRESLGEPVPDGIAGELRRGDVVFWPSHVAILTAPDRIVHASGYHMAVVAEPLAEAVARIEAVKGPPVAVRRLA